MSGFFNSIAAGKDVKSLQTTVVPAFFKSQRTFQSECVNENGAGTVYDKGTAKMLRFLKKSGEKFDRFEKYATPLNVQHHPVFKGVTFACANPFSGGLAGTIATVGGGAVTDTIVYGSLDAAAGLIGQGVTSAGMQVMGTFGLPLIIGGAVAGFLVYNGLKLLLQHHMILLWSKDQTDVLFIEFHADGLTCMHIDEDDDCYVEPGVQNRSAKLLKAILPKKMEFTQIDVKKGFSLCPGDLAKCLKGLKETNYNVMNWNCQHFAKMIGDLCDGSSVQDVLANKPDENLREVSQTQMPEFGKWCNSVQSVQNTGTN